MAESSTLGCDSGDTACLCAKPDFQFGISDCAKQACGADLAPSVTDYASSLCASELAVSQSFLGLPLRDTD